MVYSDLHICAGPVLPCHMRPDECSVMHAARQVTSSCTLARLVSSDWSLQGSWSPGACVHEQGCWCGKCASHRSLCAPQRGRLSQAMPVQHTPRSLVLEQHPERYLHMRPTCHPQPARLTKKGGRTIIVLPIKKTIDRLVESFSIVTSLQPCPRIQTARQLCRWRRSSATRQIVWLQDMCEFDGDGHTRPCSARAGLRH